MADFSFRQRAQAMAYIAAAQAVLGLGDADMAEWLVGAAYEVCPAHFDDLIAEAEDEGSASVH